MLRTSTPQRHVLGSPYAAHELSSARKRGSAVAVSPARRAGRVHRPRRRGRLRRRDGAVAALNESSDVRTAAVVAMSEAHGVPFPGVTGGLVRCRRAPARRTLVRRHVSNALSSRRDGSRTRPCARRGASSATILSPGAPEQRTPAAQVRLELCPAGLPPADCRRSTATRQCPPSQKSAGRDSPAEQNGHARDPGCSPRSPAQQRVSQPARPGEIADFDQHPYAVCGIASTLPGCRSRRCASRNSTVAERALRPRAPRPTRALLPVCDGLRVVGKRRERGRHLHQDAAVSSDRGEMRWRSTPSRPAPTTAPGKA